MQTVIKIIHKKNKILNFAKKKKKKYFRKNKKIK